MASTLDIFYQIFSLNYSTEELRQTFNNHYQLALVGSERDLGDISRWLGEPVKNTGNLHCQMELKTYPLPDRRNFDKDTFRNVKLAIVHFGSTPPSMDYLRFCTDCFPQEAKLLLVMDELNYTLEFGPTDTDSIEEDRSEELAEEVIAKAEEACREFVLPSAQEVAAIRPAWMGTEESGGGRAVSAAPEQELITEGGDRGANEQPTATQESDEEHGAVEGGAVQDGGRLQAEFESGVTEQALAPILLSKEETRTGPAWKNSEPLSNYFVNDSSWGTQELILRCDPTLDHIYTLKCDDDGESFYSLLYENSSNWIYSLARDFSTLRAWFAQFLIKDAAQEAAIAAAASSVTTSLPVVGTVISLFAVSGETLFITAQQIRLALLIGAIYGRPMDFFERMHELLPVVGSAWGWRVLAREFVGLVPAWGIVPKTVIAWSGTYAVGKISQCFYEKGEPLSSVEREQIEEEAERMAVQAITEEVTQKN